MSRRSRVLTVVAVLLGLQLGAALLYRVVETRRAPQVDSPFSFERVGPPEAPFDLRFETRDGKVMFLRERRGAPVLLHFWASWCAPCRKELPDLLSFSREAKSSRGVSIIAVSVDDDWRSIEAFFGGNIPSEVVRLVDGRAKVSLGLGVLPDTRALTSSGRVAGRVRGSRDWRSSGANELLEALLGND